MNSPLANTPPLDAAAFARLIDDHARFPQIVLGLIQGVDLGMLRNREASHRWSPLEILVHLRDEEIEDFRVRAKAALAGESEVPPIRPQEWVTERRYNEMDPGAVFLDFAKERADSCRWLQTVNLGDLDRSITIPRAGTMRAGDFIVAWRMHDLLHVRQLSSALALLTWRKYTGWRVEYAGEMPTFPTAP